MMVPPFPTGRLGLRLTPDRHGRAALDIYRPLLFRGELVKKSTALISMLPFPSTRYEPIVGKLVAALQIRVDGACVMQSSTPTRQIIGLAADGRLVAVAKVGAVDDAGLAWEAAILSKLQPVARVHVPLLLLAQQLDDERFACITAPVFGPPRREPAVVGDTAVALARHGITHGDFAPWNLVGDPPTLLDWEASRTEFLPLFDLTHFVLRTETLLGARDPVAAVTRLCGRTGIGARYAEAVGLDQRALPALVADYLDRTEQVGCSQQEEQMRGRVRRLLTRFAELAEG